MCESGEVKLSGVKLFTSFRGMVLAQKIQNMKGALLMMLAMFVFSAVDAIAKLLTADYHPVQIVWTRQLGLMMCVCVLLLIKGPMLFQTAHLKLQIFRGVIAIGSAILFIFSIKFVPLADAITITFISPFIVTIAGAFILKERIGVYRWLAVLVGFVGALIVLRPGFNSFHPALLLAGVAASLFALRQIISRHIGAHDSTLTTILYTAIAGFALTSIPLPFVFEMPANTTHLLLMCVLAVLAACGEILVIRSLEIALAVAVAPLHYTILLWGSLYGYFLFGHIADFWTWVGAFVIIASGLFTVYREWIRNHQLAAGK